MARAEGPPPHRPRIVDLSTHAAIYLTVQQFAAHLGFTDRTVRKWIDAGILPAYRFPPITGDWRIRTTDAVAFIEQARFQEDREP